MTNQHHCALVNFNPNFYDYISTSLLTRKELLAVPRKSDNFANKSNDDHNMELDGQSEEDLLNSKLQDKTLSEQNHTNIKTRKTVDRLVREHLHLKCQNVKREKREIDARDIYKNVSLRETETTQTYDRDLSRLFSDKMSS